MYIQVVYPAFIYQINLFPTSKNKKCIYIINRMYTNINMKIWLIGLWNIQKLNNKNHANFSIKFYITKFISLNIKKLEQISMPNKTKIQLHNKKNSGKGTEQRFQSIFTDKN